jgi:CDP-glycerol glycerophosphotransferase
MGREAAAWDHLLAQNQYSADIFAPAFGYSGPIHVLGYPRNDPLAGEGATLGRRQARASLGLADDQVLVLYTPTWRDTAKDDAGRYRMVSHLDLHEWFDRSPSHWVLGVRGHANTRGPGTHDERVLDLTDHPDIADLYLAADAMVTDYSSTMFDFSVTGRPMLFWSRTWPSTATRRGASTSTCPTSLPGRS